MPVFSRFLGTVCAAWLLLGGCASAPPSPYPYGGYLPADYNSRPDARFPLILFLHGAGDTNPQERMIPDYARQHAGFPFIVITPRASEDWSVERLDDLMAQLQQRFRIDPSRRYLTGLSMGAFGAWKLAAAHPETFAAVAMVAGGGEPDQACRLRGLPVWLIHNLNDEVVPVRNSKQLAAALSACGATVRLSLQDKPAKEGWSHDAWSALYHSAALYEWFLAQRRPAPP